MHDKIRQIRGKSVKTVTPLRKGVTWVTFKDNTCVRLTDKSPFVHHLLRKAKDKDLGSSKIVAIAQDSLNREWILTDKVAKCIGHGMAVRGNFRYVLSKGRDTWFVGNDGRIMHLCGTRKRLIASGNKNVDVKYCICTENSVFTAGNNGVVVTFSQTKRTVALSKMPANYIYKDSKNRIWTFGNSNVI